MPRVHLSGRSRADLDEIADFLGRHSAGAAGRAIDHFVDRLKILRDHPLAGHPPDDLRSGLRSLRSGNYLILHYVHPERMDVSRIVHHSRDLGALQFIDPSP